MTVKKMRIMHVLGAKNSGGAELFYLRLVIALQKRCDVLCVVRRGSWMETQLQENNIPHKSAPFGGFFDFKTKRLLKKYIQDYKPQVIQGWMNRACKALPKTNVPTVGRLGGYYALKNYKNCDYLVGNTIGIQDYVVAQGWPKEKAGYLPNFSPLPHADFRGHRAAVRREYNLPEDAKVLFIAGRLHKVKGIDLAIHALRGLDDDVHLLIAGAGTEELALKELAASEGVSHRVCFAGWASQLSVVASAIDIWLVPSRYEPLGNVVLDAWAHEIPLVAAEAAGPKSLILNEISGMLVPLESVDALAQAIDRILKDKNLAKTIVEGGVSALDASFSERVVIGKYLEFYQDISQ
ncbi:MAG: glycosyltransferase involved in cell wall biosynthesis [Alphaproteobacteria bacterium]|jgi:glycosyltransferase involved in cell wall biosynthesis